MGRKNQMTPVELTSINRIKWLVDSYCGGSQQALADKTGVAKASISQYLNYRNAPSNLTAEKLAKPWGLSPAWIMGFDVPMHESDEINTTDHFRQEMFDEERVLFDYKQLSESSKETVRNIIKALKSQDENQRLDDD